MKTIVSLALLLTLTGYAASTDRVYVLEEALELSAKQVRFSLTGVGSITVRSCRDCAPQTIRLSTTTEFFVNGERMERDLFARLSRDGGGMYVFYDTRTGDVTRMRLNSRLSGVNRSSR